MENSNLQKLIEKTAPLINELKQHRIYSKITNMNSLKIYMEHHIFASWDSMSLLKSLQSLLAKNEILWIPSNNKIATRYINELILEEESDILPDGQTLSHFELYLNAMKEIGASTKQIETILDRVECGENLIENLTKDMDIPNFVTDFMKTTFAISKSGSLSKIASTIYFARENLIPVIFPGTLEFIEGNRDEYISFEFYVKRHIELDSGSHSILAKNSLLAICGNNEPLWRDAETAALDSLKARINLWNGIADKL